MYNKVKIDYIKLKFTKIISQSLLLTLLMFYSNLLDFSWLFGLKKKIFLASFEAVN